MALPAIPDELLAEIFLRLPSPDDVISASRVCASFYRVVADRSFLRRFRKIHVPPLLGFVIQLRLDNKHLDLHPSVAPYPSTSAANAISAAADFSFSFLPAGNWALRDSRDGRVLLDIAHYDDGPGESFFSEIVVCDPLHRRYLLLPPIPDDLVAAVEDAAMIKQRRSYQTFLLPPDGDDDQEGTSFRVIWMAMCETKLVAFVLCSSIGQWRAGPSRRWRDLSLVFCAGSPLIYRRSYANGCFYWLIDWTEKLLVLHTRMMEFSCVDAPPGTKRFRRWDIAIVEEGNDTLGMFLRASDTSYHKYTVGRNNDGSYSQWNMVKTMSVNSTYFFMGSIRRYVLLCKYGTLDAGIFSLDIKTFQLERVCASLPGFCNSTHIYSNFPPSFLSTPTISSGAKEGAEEAMLEQGVHAS